MRAIMLTLAVALLPMSALGQVNNLRLAVVDQIRVYGCRLNDETARAMPDRLGVTREALTSVVMDLVLDGLLILGEGREIVLAVALCSPAVAYAETLTGTSDAKEDEANAILASAVVAIFRLNGCAMTSVQIDEALSPLGLTQGTTNDAALVLFEAGGLLWDDATEQTRLSSEQCLGSSDPLPAPHGQIIALFAGSSNCRITGSDAVAVIQQATGFPRPLSEGLTALMTERGELYQDGDAVVLAPLLCAQ